MTTRTHTETKEVATQSGNKRCFVISPLGELGSETRQKADDFLKYIIEDCPAIKELHYEIQRADKLSEPGRITSQITRAIVEADLIIADVTGANPNVYYEMALRHAVGKPIIVCAEHPTVLPFDTRDNRTIFYTMHSRLAEQARQELAGQIRAINKEGFKPDNPIADAVGIIELARTGEKGTALVLEHLNEISGRLSALENQQRAASARPSVFEYEPGKSFEYEPSRTFRILTTSDEVRDAAKSGYVKMKVSPRTPLSEQGKPTNPAREDADKSSEKSEE